jgi:hypothetical protein
MFRTDRDPIAEPLIGRVVRRFHLGHCFGVHCIGHSVGDVESYAVHYLSLRDLMSGRHCCCRSLADGVIRAPGL